MENKRLRTEVVEAEAEATAVVAVGGGDCSVCRVSWRQRRR